MTVDPRDGVDPGCTCPYCGAKLDAAMDAALGPGRPEEGNPTICAYCAGLSIFTSDGMVRFPTDDELSELAWRPDVALARDAVLAGIRRRPGL